MLLSIWASIVFVLTILYMFPFHTWMPKLWRLVVTVFDAWSGLQGGGIQRGEISEAGEEPGWTGFSSTAGPVQGKMYVEKMVLVGRRWWNQRSWHRAIATLELCTWKSRAARNCWSEWIRKWWLWSFWSCWINFLVVVKLNNVFLFTFWPQHPIRGTLWKTRYPVLIAWNSRRAYRDGPSIAYFEQTSTRVWLHHAEAYADSEICGESLGTLLF